MDMEKLALIFEAVKVLPLRETDLLVFRTNARLDKDSAVTLRDALEEWLGHVRILILDGGADLEVVRREVEPPLAEPQPAEAPAHRPIAPAPPRNRAPGAI